MLYLLLFFYPLDDSSLQGGCSFLITTVTQNTGKLRRNLQRWILSKPATWHGAIVPGVVFFSLSLFFFFTLLEELKGKSPLLEPSGCGRSAPKAYPTAKGVGILSLYNPGVFPWQLQLFHAWLQGWAHSPMQNDLQPCQRSLPLAVHYTQLMRSRLQGYTRVHTHAQTHRQETVLDMLWYLLW